MRRLSRLAPLAFVFMLLPLGILQAQPLAVGGGVLLPLMPSAQEPAIVSLRQGGFAAASTRPTSHRTGDLYVAIVDGDGETLLNDWRNGQHIPTAIDLVATPGGFVYTHLDLADLSLRNRLMAVPFDPQGDGSYTPFVINPDQTFPAAYSVTALENGHLMALWTDEDLDGDRSGRPGLMAQRFSDQGDLLGAPLLIAEGEFLNPRVAAAPGDGFLAVWQRQGDLEVLAQAFDANHRGGPVRQVVEAAESVADLELSALPDGRFLVVWSEVNGDDASMIYARRLNAQGQAFNERIAVNNDVGRQLSRPKVATDRFGRSWVVWMESSMSGAREAHLRLLNADGTVGGGAWVLPNTENAAQLYPDVAVDADGAAMVVWTEEVAGDRSLRGRTVRTDDMCSPDDTVLCLHGGRFQVQVDWTDYEGLSGLGRVVPFQSTDSGLFWFFEARNWELMVKVIDGCSFNGFYWVYAAATTDVAYRMVVTDTTTGLQQVYENRLGEAAPATTDSVALMSCPLGPP